VDVSQFDTDKLQRLFLWSILAGTVGGGALGVYGWVATVRGLLYGVVVAGMGCLAAAMVTDGLARAGSRPAYKMLVGASVLSALYLAGVLAVAIFIVASGQAHLVRPP